MKTLDEKILNGETEVQRAYRNCMADLENLEKERVKIVNRLAEIYDLGLKARAMIEKCKRRAEEQGYPNLFD